MKRILILEDDDSQKEIIRRSFDNKNYEFEVIFAKSLQECKGLLKTGWFDLIFVDWLLPDGNGMEVFTFPEVKYKIPVIVMTSYGNESTAVQAMKSGALDYVLKNNRFFTDISINTLKWLRDWEVKISERNYFLDIHRNEERYRVLIEKADSGFCIINNSEYVLDWNQSLESMTGYSFSDVEKMKISDLFDVLLVKNSEHKEDSLMYLEIKRIFSDASLPSIRIENEIVRKDGKIALLSIQIYAIVTTQGVLVGLNCFEKERTEPKKSELDLLFNTLDMISDPVLISDSKGVVLFANKILYNHFNLVNRSLVNCNFQSIFEESKGGSIPMINHFEDDKYENFDLKIKSQITNNLQVHVLGNILKINNLKYILWEIHDVSEQVRLINELTLAKINAEKSDKLKSIFIQNISHEVRTPLNAIVGFSDLLSTYELNPPKRKEYLKNIQEKSFELLEIINKILDISALQSGNLQTKELPTSLGQFFEELKNNICHRKQQLQKERICVKTKIHLSLNQLYVNIDSVRLHQVLYHLIDNSLKYTNTGFIDIFCSLNNDKKLLFEITDTGVGIEPEQMPHIFDIFRQGNETMSREFGGTGLGLTLVKSIVQMLGGEIWVESEVNKGSTFYFTVPYNPAEISTKFEMKIPDKWEVLKEKLILVVEDDSINYLFFEELFQNYQANTIHAPNGLTAVKLCMENPIDIVLMDMQLPDLNGNKITEIIKKYKKNIPVIAQTAFASEEDRRKATMAGCDIFMTKPINKGQLLDNMVKLLLNNGKLI